MGPWEVFGCPANGAAVVLFEGVADPADPGHLWAFIERLEPIKAIAVGGRCLHMAPAVCAGDLSLEDPGAVEAVRAAL